MKGYSISRHLQGKLGETVTDVKNIDIRILPH